MEAAITDQVAALPYRFGHDGNVEVMLVTSRSGEHHWIPPKGHLMAGKLPHEAAAQEAYEEAGVIGEISSQPIGEYSAMRRRPDGTTEALNILVFPMLFVERLSDWPERGQRAMLWFEPADAAKAVQEPELANLLARFKPDPAVVASLQP